MSVDQSRAREKLRIITVGGSAGGMEAFREMLPCLDSEFNASIFLTLHLHEHTPARYPDLLSDESPFPVSYAADEQPIEPGRIYIAPPDRHLLIQPDRVRLSSGPRENRSRPAIDPMFRSAAVYHGSSVIGVVLSGLLDDGAAGLLAIQRCGGVVMAQSPDSAQYPDMPEAAQLKTSSERSGSPASLAEQINALARQATPEPITVPEDIQIEAAMTERTLSSVQHMDDFGNSVGLSCPSCSGPLWEKSEPGSDRYRCHIGHSFTEMSLLAEQNDAVERGLWTALRTLEERCRMLDKMANQAVDASRKDSAEQLQKRSTEAHEEAAAIRKVLAQVGRASIGQHTRASA